MTMMFVKDIGLRLLWSGNTIYTIPSVFYNGLFTQLNAFTDGNNIALRPVVCLNSNVTTSSNENDAIIVINCQIYMGN